MRRTLTTIIMLTLPLGCVLEPAEIARFTVAEHEQEELNYSYSMETSGAADTEEPWPGCDGECPPHPHLCCVDLPPSPEEVAPECVEFIGTFCHTLVIGDMPGWAETSVPCTDVSDCWRWDPGESEVTCDEDGYCNWSCADGQSCPSDLVCLNDDIPWLDAQYWGECWAPGVEPH
jgi:hypothetical protein